MMYVRKCPTRLFAIKLYVLPITNICDDVRKYAFKYQQVILYAFVILYLKYELMLYMRII